MTLKELLGDKYKDGMSFEEIEAAMAGRKFADLTSGDYQAYYEKMYGKQ